MIRSTVFKFKSERPKFTSTIVPTEEDLRHSPLRQKNGKKVEDGHKEPNIRERV